MPTNVIMPQLGESVVEGTVTRWLHQVGDTVREYEPLLEVSTDKVDTEVPAPAEGTLLEVYVQEGQTVKAGVLLAVIGKPGEVPSGGESSGGVSHSGHPPQPVMETTVATTTAAHTNGGKAESHDSMRISPVVARMAAEHQLDLTQIKGTGTGGRVTKKDVEAYLQNPTSAPTTDLPPWEQPGSGDLFKPTGEFKPQAKPAAVASPPAASVPSTPPRAIPAEPIPQGVPGELVTLSNMRRAIADHMVRSKLQTSPHVTTVFEIDMSQVMTHREAHKAEFAKSGVNLTLTAYFLAAMVDACRAVPIINSQWTDEGIYLHHIVNIGMAVAIDDGLIVPIIKNAGEYNLMGLARQANDLANRARNKQLKPDDIQGGTITITNHGVSGSLFATPIINQPQAAIFGVGIIEKRVKVINDAIAIRPCCYASLTFDHRIADGATGDGWMMTLKERLENWA
ncbi:MAG: 2-oxo acid dehydrogenase subunit E2 [Chloroflexi bacterium]|nr:2-oxo acid dehydrogenase subunit E2 [Chloroflexota bacterium]